MKKRHQVQITIKEADIISRALFWYLQYLPYRDMIHCREIYDKFSRIYQILDYKNKKYDKTEGNIGQDRL